MRLRNITFFTVFLCSVILFGWIGCSDDTITTYISSDDPLDQNLSGPTIYFPLQEGYGTVYDITYSNGKKEISTFQVGKEVSFVGINAVKWYVNNATGLDSSYFQVTNDAILFYESIYSKPEKILELPLEPGHSWTRFTVTATDDNQDDFTDIITSYDKDTLTDGNTVNKTYPIEGEVTMVVEKIENLTLKDGTYYSKAIRVANESLYTGKKNYYWFVAGIGLVKYVIGATDLTYPNGDLVSELVDYGY